MGFILMYDVTNEESFQAVQDWYASLYLLFLNETLIIQTLIICILSIVVHCILLMVNES